MTLQRQIGFWLAALVVFLVFLLLFSSILLPFVAGMAVAYGLDPIADWFERRGMSRLMASLTILVLFVLIFVLALILVVPVLANQLAGFIERLPGYVERLQFLATTMLGSRVMKFLEIDTEALRGSMGQLMSEGASWLTSLLQSIWSGGQTLLSILSLFVITPVVAFYMLLDWDRMVARVDSWLPRNHVEDIRAIARDIDAAVAGFVRGQGLVCVVLGLFYALLLGAIGLNFGFLIGFGAGVLSFIPYVGSTIGFVVSVGVALVQFWPDWIWIVATVIIFALGQFIEGNILQPKLVGASVGLHPVWLMFALFAFGVLFGFVGLLIAVPAAAAIGVVMRFGMTKYLTSAIYRGVHDEPDDDI
ncbi:AI-2E family transporter [Prosthecomicrobium pneumaticum]|uniref:Putative PurR-regulated permease PerM n=1 Tax=Prosthecomicrobium pneumaticum TaxID=81895 RepID=A0A7W9FJ80_9HYPH|nr:putative PurR-regulated permease PerM [Prosthecomicrobium pneumaticum]